MTTTKSSSASIASRIAAAANGGGTYITDALHPVYYLASWQFLNTGRPRLEDPAILDFTPLTIYVPYSNAYFVWKDPYILR